MNVHLFLANGNTGVRLLLVEKDRNVSACIRDPAIVRHLRRIPSTVAAPTIRGGRVVRYTRRSGLH